MMEIDLEKEFRDADENAAKAAKVYSEHMYTQKLYEGLTKDMLAAIKMRIRSETPEKCSDAELEMRARASEEWRKFREEQMKTLREAGAAEIKYNNAVRRWETKRSILSVRKTEVKRFGG